MEQLNTGNNYYNLPGKNHQFVVLYACKLKRSSSERKFLINSEKQYYYHTIQPGNK